VSIVGTGTVAGSGEQGLPGDRLDLGELIRRSREHLGRLRRNTDHRLAQLALTITCSFLVAGGGRQLATRSSPRVGPALEFRDVGVAEGQQLFDCFGR